MTGLAPGSIAVVVGTDDVLRSRRRASLVAETVGDGDAGLLVTEFVGDDYELADVVRAAETPPFLTDIRVVVASDVERFKKQADLAPLVDHLADPLPTTVLVLEWAGAKVVKALADPLAQAGAEVIQTDPGRKLDQFVDDALRETGLDADRALVRRLVDWLGDDPGQLAGLLPVLVSTYGTGTRLDVEDVEPFLGEGGGVPPWDLTDAIDRGDIPSALTTLHRMLGSGRHPLQLMATLHAHFQRMLRLDGAAVRGEKEAATLLGMRGSTFPAKKALAQCQRLGSQRIAASMQLLAATDLELKGAVEWPEDLSMEILVARLARLAKTAR